MKLLRSLIEYRNKDMLRQEERIFYYGKLQKRCIFLPA